MERGKDEAARRAVRKAARARQVRRQKRMVLGTLVVLFLLVIVIGINIYQRGVQKKQKEAEKAAVKAAVEKCYGNFLAADQRGKSVQETEKQKEDFANWIMEKYPEKTEGKLLDQAEKGEITARDMYSIFGETLQVLTDRKKGYLKDEQTAKAHQIYLRKGKTKKEAEVTVAGDICFAEDGYVLDHYDEVEDLKQCISPNLLEMMKQSDVFYLNHEYTVSERGEPLEGKRYTFRAKPERMELLKQMGTDLVSLANNHVFDYGEEAMLDTCDYLEQAGIPYVGGGRNKKEASSPVYFIVNGMKIGFVAATNAEITRFTPAAEEDSPGVLEAYETEEYNQITAEAAENCDYLIAYMHWGPEDNNHYADYQTEQGRKLLNSGADIVVGGHPHVLQGMEYVDGKPIVYSLGDFWFNKETKYTGLLKLNITYDGLKEMSFVPCLQTGYTTQYLEKEEEQRKLYDFIRDLSPNIKIDDNGVITES